LLVAQVSHVLDAVVDTIRLEVLEVEPATGVGRVELAREIYKFDQGTTDLCREAARSTSHPNTVGEKRGLGAYVDSDVAHNRRMVW
jgi:hypothetical protein